VTIYSYMVCNMNNGTILLIDDEDVVLNVAEQVLRRAGYHVISAQNGIEAVHLTQSYVGDGRRLAAVIMDLSLPGHLIGVELAEEIREVDSKIAVIISSGHTDDRMMVDYKAFGFTGKLAKPYKAGDLLSAVENATGVCATVVS